MGAMVELVECGSKPAAHGARPPLTVHPTGQRWALSGQIDRYTKCMIVHTLLQQVYDCYTNVCYSKCMIVHCYTKCMILRGRVRLQVLFNFHLDPSSCNSPWARVK